MVSPAPLAAGIIVIADGNDAAGHYSYRLTYEGGRWLVQKTRRGGLRPHTLYSYPADYSRDDAARETGVRLALGGAKRPNLRWLDCAAADAAAMVVAPRVGGI